MLDQKGIRKAAVFLNGLDWETANMLLKRLPAEESRAVRREMVAIDGISSKEINHTVKQFLQETKYGHNRSKLPSHEKAKNSKTVLSEDGFDMFELSSNVPENVGLRPECSMPAACSPNEMAHETVMTDTPAEPRAEEKKVAKDIPANAEPRRFDYLERVSAFDTARFLAEESEQLIAVVLSQMTPRYSGDVLACFEQSLKMALIRRLAKLDATDEMVLDEIDDVLKDRLKREVEELPRSKPGLALLEQILHVVDGEINGENVIGNDIIAGLNEVEYEEQLAAQQTMYNENDMYGELYDEGIVADNNAAMWEFDDLAFWDDHELGLLFREMNREIVVQALLTCDDAFVGRVLKCYPVYEQVSLRKMMRSLETNDGCDANAQWYARQCVVQGAAQLVEEGLISDIPLLPPQSLADVRSVLVDYSA
jgi:Flagellar motor switch protein